MKDLPWLPNQLRTQDGSLFHQSAVVAAIERTRLEGDARDASHFAMRFRAHSGRVDSASDRIDDGWSGVSLGGLSNCRAVASRFAVLPRTDVNAGSGVDGSICPQYVYIAHMFLIERRLQAHVSARDVAFRPCAMTASRMQ